MNPSDAEVGKFREPWINSIAADALASCVTRASWVTVLTMYDTRVSVIHGIEFEWPAPS